MGLDKWNPFKKSSKHHLSAENDQLAPAKSTSSFAGSIRSLGDKAEQFMNEADKPRLPFQAHKNDHVNLGFANPGLTTAGLSANDAGVSPATNLR